MAGRFVIARRTHFTQFPKISLAAGLPSSRSTRSITVSVSGSQLADKCSLSGFGAESCQVHFEFSFVIVGLRARPNLAKVAFDLNRRDDFTD